MELEGEGDAGADVAGVDSGGDGLDDVSGDSADSGASAGEGGSAAPAAPGGSAGSGDEAPADVLLTFTEEEWAQELLADQDTKGESYRLTKEQLDELPLEAKQALASLAHRGKALEQQLAEHKAQTEQRLREAQAAEERALKATAESLAWTDAPKLREFIDGLKPKGNQPDPSSPEGIEWLADKRVADRMEAFFAALKEDGNARKAAAEAAKAETERNARLEQIQAYMDKYPDDFADDSPSYKAIQALYQKAKGALTVEECHRAVRAQMLEAELEKTDADNLTQARARVQRGGTRGKPIPEAPKHLKTTEERDAWYEANPEARERDIERLLRQGAL